MSPDLTIFHLALAAAAGAGLSSVLACLPALHVYTVAGILIVLSAGAREAGAWPDPLIACFLMGLVVGFAMVSTVPAIFLGAPDEAAVFMTLPGQKFLMQGRGREAAILTAAGGLGGLLFLAAMAPFASGLFRTVQTVLAPHLAWILSLVVAFLVLSEWPKGGDRGRTALARLWDGWKTLLAGIATLLLSGLLGFVISYRPVVPVESAFQTLMPAFVGLFAVPWVLQNALSGSPIPPQVRISTVDLPPSIWLRGTGAGCMGGLFAAYFPIVTGGMGGLLAGHATAQRDDRLFIVSQGASKVVYYVGGFLLLFVPGLHLRRGGMAAMASGIFTPRTDGDFYMVTGAILIGGAVSFFLLLAFTEATLGLIRRVNYRWVSWATLVLIAGLVAWTSGPGGLAVTAVASGIGAIPVWYNSRRMNCMGVLLLPVILNMAGVGDRVAGWLGLL